MKRLLTLFLFVLPFISLANTSRIVSTAPALTEIVFALRAQDQLVGVSNFCNYPKKAKELPQVGSSLGLDKESLLKLKPSKVILTKIRNNKVKENLSALGISYQEFALESLSDILKTINELGKLLAKENEAKDLVNKINKQLSSARKSAKKLKVLVVIGHAYSQQGFRDFFVMGPQTFYNDILSSLGLVNIYQEKVSTPILSNEQLLRMNPDAIIDILAPMKGEEYRKEVESLWIEKYSHLTAVKNKKVFVIQNDYALIPGPRILNTLSTFQEFFQ